MSLLESSGVKWNCIRFIQYFFILSGNLLTILATILDPLKSLRSPFISFLINLAVADALQGGVAIPFVIHQLLNHDQGLRLTSLALHAITCISLLSVFFGTVVISIDRYIAITRPIKYRVTLSWQRCLKISILMWIISIVSGLAVTFYPLESISFMTYNYFMLITGIIVMVIVFTRVYRFLKHHEQIYREQLRRASIASTSSRYNTEKRVTVVLLIVLSIFMVTYIPALAMLNITHFCFECSCNLRFNLYVIRYIFLVLNSAINPFVYAIRIKDIRNSILALFVCDSTRRNLYRPLSSMVSSSEDSQSIS